MLDTKGRKISVGDAVVICRSAKNNSTLTLGGVTKVDENHVWYRVIHAGARISNANHPQFGEERICTTPHRIYVLGKQNVD